MKYQCCKIVAFVLLAYCFKSVRYTRQFLPYCHLPGPLAVRAHSESAPTSACCRCPQATCSGRWRWTRSPQGTSVQRNALLTTPT